MRRIRYTMVLVFIFISARIFSQEPDSTLTCEYELIATGEVLNVGDTLYNLIVFVEEHDLEKFKRLYQSIDIQGNDIFPGTGETVIDQKAVKDGNRYTIQINNVKGAPDWVLRLETRDSTLLDPLNGQYVSPLNGDTTQVRFRRRTLPIVKYESIK